MPRFYLHMRDANFHLHDEEGFVAGDAASALRHALQAAGDMIADGFGRGEIPVAFELRLDDEQGARVATLPIYASVDGLETCAIS